MIQGIINAFTNALGMVFAFVPRLVGFLVILFIGWLVSYAVGKAVTMLLRKVGFERLSERAGLTRLEQRMGMRMDTAGILGKIAFWFIFLIFLVPATDSLGLPTVSNTLNTIVGYIPNVFVAVLVLFLGTLVAVFASDLVRRATSATKVGNSRIFGTITRWSIIAFAAMIALEQLQIAPALINSLFTAIVAGLALAFGLAFGLGGRETVQRWLARGESQIMGNRPYNPEQIVQQARTDLAHSEQMGQQYAGSQTAPSTYATQQNVPPVHSPYPTQQTVPPTPHGSSEPTPHGYVPPTPHGSSERPPQWPTNPRSDKP